MDTNPILLGLLIIVSIIGIYITYRYMYPSKTKVTSKLYLKNNNSPRIALKNLDTPTSATYYIDFWLYVQTFPIFSFKDFSTTYAANHIDKEYSGNIMYLDDGSFSFDVYQEGILTFYNGKQDSKDGNPSPSVYTDNIGLNKWIYIIVSVNSNFVDLYVNGKIIKSVNIPSSQLLIPSINANLIFGTTLDAYIAGMNRYTYAMDMNTAFNNYMRSKMGLVTSSSDYGIQLDLLKNKDLAKKFTVF